MNSIIHIFSDLSICYDFLRLRALLGAWWQHCSQEHNEGQAIQTLWKQEAACVPGCQELCRTAAREEKGIKLIIHFGLSSNAIQIHIQNYILTLINMMSEFLKMAQLIELKYWGKGGFLCQKKFSDRNSPCVALAWRPKQPSHLKFQKRIDYYTNFFPPKIVLKSSTQCTTIH